MSSFLPLRSSSRHANTWKCENIMVPNISLADSIVDGLYEKMMAKTEE